MNRVFSNLHQERWRTS